MLVLVLATVLSPAVGLAQGSPDSLIGIWGTVLDFRSSVVGDVTVERRGIRWTARLTNANSRLTETSDSLRFSFGALGHLRAEFRGKSDTLHGFWVQPMAETRPPTGYRQSFATPVVLSPAGANRWRATVRQLPERFTLFARVYRNAEGELVGAIRNHDINSNGGASLYRVAQVGDSVLFTMRFDDTEPEIRHAAHRARSPDRLHLFWTDVGQVIELRRQPERLAAGFYPRPPADPPYRYRRPAETDDGWITAAASQVGLDEVALTETVRSLIAKDPSARGAPLMHSILVAKGGKLVLEEYFFGWDRDTPHDLRSAGKTFSSVLLGAAMKQGHPLTPETRIYELMARRGPFANPDPRKSRVTLGHLMTHSSGLACNDYDDASPGNEDRLQNQKQEPDWWKFTLDLPMLHEPGDRYAYCSATMSLMAGALTVGTGTWLPALFEQSIARPLQFGAWHWNLTANGEGYLGGGSWLRPRDLLKIGQVYLDGGRWKGIPILDSSWVTQSTAPRMHISPATTGMTAEQFGEQYGEGVDAWAWHLGADQGDPAIREYAAAGNGGQLLIVLPKHRLTVVFTGANYRQGGIWSRWWPEIVSGRIVPAIRRP